MKTRTVEVSATGLAPVALNLEYFNSPQRRGDFASINKHKLVGHQQGVYEIQPVVLSVASEVPL